MYPTRVLKISAERISPFLTWIFNLCIKTGVYIDDWKKAWVVPIYNQKIGKNVRIIAQYQCYRLLVKFSRDPFFNQLYEFLNANSPLSKQQFGFRPKNSTLAALTQMCDTILVPRPKLGRPSQWPWFRLLSCLIVIGSFALKECCGWEQNAG